MWNELYNDQQMIQGSTINLWHYRLIKTHLSLLNKNLFSGWCVCMCAYLYVLYVCYVHVLLWIKTFFSQVWCMFFDIRLGRSLRSTESISSYFFNIYIKVLLKCVVEWSLRLWNSEEWTPYAHFFHQNYPCCSTLLGLYVMKDNYTNAQGISCNTQSSLEYILGIV